MRYALVPLFLVSLLVGCGLAPGAGETVAFTEAAAETAAPEAGPLAPAAAPRGPAPMPVPPEAFVAGIDHPFFPLTVGRSWVYEGDHEGQLRRDEIRVVEETRVLAAVACATVRQEMFLDGVLVEMSTEWYAQDGAGNLWKFGEESLELAGGLFVPAADSWVAGEDGAQPWMLLAAEPRVGDLYVGSTPHGQETMQVLSVSASASVPAGDFDDCLEVEENADDPDDTDIIIYAPGVGPVSEQSPSGGIELVSTR